MIPVTTPVLLTAATDGVPELHVPPTGVAVSEVDVPMHIALLPDIEEAPLTVIVRTATQPLVGV